ncbi:MAG: DUF4405 domain-containing protein [Acidovorax sp.]
MAALNPLRRWQYRLLYATLALLAASGVAWLAVHYLWGAGADRLPHPLEPWLMRLHGAAGFAALFMAGVLACVHVPQGWRMVTRIPHLRERWAGQRRTGLALCALGGACVASSYLLYYFAPENLRPVLGWAHAAAGLALAALLPLHEKSAPRLGDG